MAEVVVVDVRRNSDGRMKEQKRSRREAEGANGAANKHSTSTQARRLPQLRLTQNSNRMLTIELTMRTRTRDPTVRAREGPSTQMNNMKGKRGKKRNSDGIIEGAVKRRRTADLDRTSKRTVRSIEREIKKLGDGAAPLKIYEKVMSYNNPATF